MIASNVVLFCLYYFTVQNTDLAIRLKTKVDQLKTKTQKVPTRKISLRVNKISKYIPIQNKYICLQDCFVTCCGQIPIRMFKVGGKTIAASRLLLDPTSSVNSSTGMI